MRKRKRAYNSEKKKRETVQQFEVVFSDSEDDESYNSDHSSDMINEANFNDLPELETVELPSKLAEACCNGTVLFKTNESLYTKYKVNLHHSNSDDDFECIKRLYYQPEWVFPWIHERIKQISYVSSIPKLYTNEVKHLLVVLSDLVIENNISITKVSLHVKNSMQYLAPERKFESFENFIKYLENAYGALKIHEFYACNKCCSTCSLIKDGNCRNQLCEDGKCTSKFFVLSIIEILGNWMKRKEFITLIQQEFPSFQKKVKEGTVLQEQINRVTLFTFVVTLNSDWLEYQENYSLGGAYC